MSGSLYRLLGIGALQSAARWLELLAFGVYIFDVTRSPLMVTTVTLCKLAPLAVFGPVVGALPAYFPRRSLYLLALALIFFSTAAAALLAWYSSLSVWLILLISLIGGVFWAFDFPVRRALIGDAARAGNLSRAMALDVIANNGTRMLGPVLGGVLLQFVGLHGALTLCAVSYLLCWYLAYHLNVGRERVADSDSSGIVSNIVEGIKVVRDNPVLQATLMVTVTYNLFCFPMLSLVPVLGRDELQLSASAIGLLASLEGAGALLGGLLLFRYGRIWWARRTYVWGLAISLLLGLVYASAEEPVIVGLMLLFVGIGSACFAAMQTTLLVLNSDSRHRSQMFGLLSLSIGAGIVGFTQIGLLATWLGTRAALSVSAISGLLCLLLLCLHWPQILATQKEH